MKYAILIINHISAGQTERLIDRLNNGYFDFYIHIDKKLNIKAYLSLKKISNVFFIKKRVNITPGGYSEVRASINGINQISASGIKYQYISLVDGRDYPTKRADEICDFFNINSGKQFISFDEAWTAGNIAHRTERYYLPDNTLWYKGLLEKLINLFYGKPHIPANLKLTGRSAHWTITLNCAQYVVAYIDRFELDTFFKYTHGSSQFLFQSVITNSSYQNDVVNNNNRYVNRPDDEANTEVLTTKDFNKLIFADSLFAGYFDIARDEEVLDMIDRANEIKISYRRRDNS